jgi:hypothetical protein
MRVSYAGFLKRQNSLNESGFSERINRPWCEVVSTDGPVSRMGKRMEGFELEYEARWANKPDREELTKCTGLREMNLVVAVTIGIHGAAAGLLVAEFGSKSHRLVDGNLYSADLFYDDDTARLLASCILLRDALCELERSGLERLIGLKGMLDEYGHVARRSNGDALKAAAGAAVDGALAPFKADYESGMRRIFHNERMLAALTAVGGS